jgi:hypothetical protein
MDLLLRHRLLPVRAVLVALPIACCDGEVDEVRVGPVPMYAAVGDTFALRAHALDYGLLLGCPLYDSDQRPAAFRWRSADASVAVVSATGMVRVTGAGDTHIVAETGGVESSTHSSLRTSPPFATLAIDVPSRMLRVGDTLRATLRTFDDAGAEVNGVWVRALLARPQDSLAVFLPLPRVGQSPIMVQLEARRAGTLVLYAREQRWTTDVRRADSINVEIRPS